MGVVVPSEGADSQASYMAVCGELELEGEVLER